MSLNRIQFHSSNFQAFKNAVKRMNKNGYQIDYDTTGADETTGQMQVDFGESNAMPIFQLGLYYGQELEKEIPA